MLASKVELGILPLSDFAKLQGMREPQILKSRGFSFRKEALRDHPGV